MRRYPAKELVSSIVLSDRRCGRMKQVRFMQQTLRIHRLPLLDKIMGIAAGLANFKIS